MEALAFLLGFEDALGGLDWKRAIGVAGKYVVESLDAYREVAAREARKDPMPRAYAEVYHQMLRTLRNGERNEWLYARGFEGRTLQAFLIGHSGSQFTIPFFNTAGEVITIRFRRDDKIATSYFEPRDGKEHEIPKYSGITGRNGLYLYADWMLRPEMDYVVVTESELCAARLWQEGIPAVSPTNGAGQLKHVARLLEPYPQIRHIWVASDQDDPGYEGAKELIDAGLERRTPTQRLNWPREWGKDVTELLCGGHRLEECGFNEPRRYEEVLREWAGDGD